MRVVLDSNVLISALLLSTGHPAAIYQWWTKGAFQLLISDEQLRELRLTLAKPALAARIRPNHAGRLVNQLKGMAEHVGRLPRVERSPDHDDNFLLGMVEAGAADYLVTGDKSGLLALVRHGRARIVTPFEFWTLLTVK